MNGLNNISSKLIVRLSALVLAFALLLAVFIGSTDSSAFAASNRAGLFGTVVNEPHDGQITVATRSAVLTLTADGKTKYIQDKKKVSLSDIHAGMTVTGYYYTDGNVAGHLTLRKRDKKETFLHVVGVVLEKNGKSLTVKKQDGKQVEIKSPDEDDNENIEPGSMVAAVVEEDPETGDLEVTAIQTASETIEQLKKSITSEISNAQKKLLKARISETASVHLTRLYETLDEIAADTAERIEAAYAEYQAAYDETMQEISDGPVTIDVSGEVLSILPLEIAVKSDSDGTVWVLGITGQTTFVRSNGSSGTITDIARHSHVDINATPKKGNALAKANVISVVPVPINEPSPAFEPSDDTITGTIILVDDVAPDANAVIVVTQPDGSDSAASLTPDTVVIVEGEEVTVADLEPGQEVEVVLEDDGISASTVHAVQAAPEPTGTPSPSGIEPTASPGTVITTVEHTIVGTIKQVVGNDLVLDGVRLIMGGTISPPTQSQVGQEIRLRVVIDDAGRWIVVGIQE